MEPAEHHLAVTRMARYWSLGRGAARELWIVCHGYGQLAQRFLRHFEPIADDDRRIVAPEALNRFYLDGRIGRHGPESAVGATWMTREDRLTEIDDYVAWLDRLHDHVAGDTPGARIIALGFSQGTATVARWAARTDRRIDHVVLWAGGLPPELEPGPGLFGDARLTLAAGAADTMVRAEAVAREHARITAAGRTAELFPYAGEHAVPADAIRRLAFRVRDGAGL